MAGGTLADRHDLLYSRLRAELAKTEPAATIREWPVDEIRYWLRLDKYLERVKERLWKETGTGPAGALDFVSLPEWKQFDYVVVQHYVHFKWLGGTVRRFIERYLAYWDDAAGSATGQTRFVIILHLVRPWWAKWLCLAPGTRPTATACNRLDDLTPLVIEDIEQFLRTHVPSHMGLYEEIWSRAKSKRLNDVLLELNNWVKPTS